MFRILLVLCVLGMATPLRAGAANQIPGELMVFYGWPGRGMGPCTGCFPEGDNAAFRAAEFGVYDDLILGAGLELETHPEHQLVIDMLAEPAMAQTRVWGYVDAGVTTSNYLVVEIATRALAWQSMGVEGIFLDDFGYDYGTTRARQNQIVSLLHGYGLRVIANAFDPDDAFSSDYDPVYNPTAAATLLDASDFYFYESHGVRLDELEDAAQWWAKSQKIEAHRNALGFGVFSVTTKGIDLPSVFDADRFAAAWHLAVIARHSSTGYGEYSYSASGNSNTAHIHRERPVVYVGASFLGPMQRLGSVVQRRTDYGWVRVNLETGSSAVITNTVTDASPPQRGEAVLENAVPNPFNPRTEFAFVLATAAPVEIQVFDLRGRAVRTLLRTEREAGRHTVVWDGTDDAGVALASGVYAVVMRTPHGVDRTKAVLVR